MLHDKTVVREFTCHSMYDRKVRQRPMWSGSHNLWYSRVQPKIQLCSKYERHTDHRTYVERKVLFEDLAKEPPPPEIQHVRPVSEGGEQEEAAVAAEAE